MINCPFSSSNPLDMAPPLILSLDPAASSRTTNNTPHTSNPLPPLPSSSTFLLNIFALFSLVYATIRTYSAHQLCPCPEYAVISMIFPYTHTQASWLEEIKMCCNINGLVRPLCRAHLYSPARWHLLIIRGQKSIYSLWFVLLIMLAALPSQN